MGGKFYIDEDECIGCESCVEVCPEAFKFNEDSELAEVIDPNLVVDCIEEAMEVCPVDCIYWE